MRPSPSYHAEWGANGVYGLSGHREKQDSRQLRTVLLHHAEELDDDLGARPDQDLALARLLGIVDALESVVQDRRSHHGGGSDR